jgi:hypothetical protein
MKHTIMPIEEKQDTLLDFGRFTLGNPSKANIKHSLKSGLVFFFFLSLKLYFLFPFYVHSRNVS